MFISFRKKTFIAILFVLLLTCQICWCGTWGNTIPKDASLNPANSNSKKHAGFLIMNYMWTLYSSEGSGNYSYSLDADGESNFHYLNASVGDTDVVYNENAVGSTGAGMTKAYNYEMITGIITCNTNVTSISGTFYSEWTFKKDDYYIPHKCVLIKVSGFSDTSDEHSYSNNADDWLLGSRYEVIGVIDCTSSNSTTVQYTLYPNECIHVVQVPFAYSNTTYFSGAYKVNTSGEITDSGQKAGLYRARYHTDYTYTVASGKTVKSTNDTGDGWETFAYVTDALNDYETLTFQTNPTMSSMTLTELLANKTADTTKGTTLSMNYAAFRNTNPSQQDKLYISFGPYNNLDEYYFIKEGSSTTFFEGNMKLTNFSSSNTLYFSNDGTTYSQLTETSIDTATTKTPFFMIETQTASSSSDNRFNYELDGSISFDIYPYIDSYPETLPGNYSMSVVLYIYLN